MHQTAVAVPAGRRTIPAAALGLNPVARWCLGATLAVLLVSAPLYWLFGLSLDLSLSTSRAVFVGAVLAAWAYYFTSPGRPAEWITPEAIFAFFTTLILGIVLTPAQYVAAAFNRPLADPWLAAADAALGIHVPGIVALVATWPALNALLTLAYQSLIWQFLAIIPVLWLLNDRRAIWEYAWHFHACSIVTTATSAILPVACAFTFYGFDSTIDQARFVTHFEGIRAGTMNVIPYHDMEGLVSLPSFHAAAGFMLAWVVRRHRLLFAVVAPWNALLVVSTVTSGAHYAVDVIAAGGLFAGSVWAWHRWAASRIDPVTIR